ncbi:MAG: ABC transporter permease [Clostridia bacterium]|nr:ABC transporter permease [Clostridia bacterium]MBQ1435441.1 ABC transporter permease [Clostridia bacterium]
MEAKKREPLLRVVKHAELSRTQSFLLRLLAVVVALVVGGIFIASIGYNPLEVYKTMVVGCFRSVMAFQATIKFCIPMCIAALGVTLAFKMKFWNIGGEGQLIMGAVFASYFALFCDGMPHVPLIIIMFLAGFVGGGIWGLIPALCREKWGTNETLFTLMLNYIALYIVTYLRDGPWRDPQAAGFNKIARFSANSQLDKVAGIHFGWIIMIVLVVFVFIYLSKTKQGYEISVVGESRDTARYAGINVRRVVIRTMFLSGGIAGIAGMIQACGADATLSTGVANGVGFTGIIIAWLAQLNPIATLVVAFAFSILEKGSSVIQSSFGLSTACADVLQGIILFFIMAIEFFVRYKIVFAGHKEKKLSQAKPEKKEAAGK